ncbi:MAG: hypothetical protein JF606_29790, partial [Burkholderiales bacterium]|nr:hypothetical protein [Burkholderiales bacterium]
TEPAWVSAAPVLDALLSIGDANAEPARGAQQLTKQYAAMNAMRLWDLMQRTVAEFHEPVRLVNVSGRRGRWRWPADCIGVQLATQIQVEIRSDHAVLAVTLHVQALPALAPQLDVVGQTSLGGRRLWITDPPAVPLGYAEARALLTTLAFGRRRAPGHLDGPAKLGPGNVMWLDFARFAGTFSAPERLKRFWRNKVLRLAIGMSLSPLARLPVHCFRLFESRGQADTPCASQASPQTPQPQEDQ